MSERSAGETGGARRVPGGDRLVATWRRRAAGLARDGAGAAPSVPARTLAGLLALGPVAAATLYRVANNAPGALPGGLGDLAAALGPAAPVGPALAGLLLAATVAAPRERVGLVAAGGFGLVALASPAAWLPAAVGVACGGALVAGGRSARPWDEVGRASPGEIARATRRGVVPLLLAAAVVASLAATAGVAPATLRPLGTTLALAGVGLAPVLVGVDGASLVAGGVAGGLVVAVASSAPYVAGAVLLVGAGVVGAPLVVVALAVAGGVAAVAVALRRGRVDAALGAGLLLAAGVPGTPSRALAVVVALALLAPPGGESA